MAAGLAFPLVVLAAPMALRPDNPLILANSVEPGTVATSAAHAEPDSQSGTPAGEAERVASFQARLAILQAYFQPPETPQATASPAAGLKTLSAYVASPAETAAGWSAAPGQTDADCLAQAIYHEARSEPETGQAAVAQVVMNRLRDPRYPKTVCGVVFQGAPQPGCQFSFACDGSMQRAAFDPAAWGEARRVAERALAGGGVDAVGGSTNYHADYVKPTWAKTLLKVASIGRHIFYKAVGGVVPPGAQVSEPMIAETASAPARAPARRRSNTKVAAVLPPGVDSRALPSPALLASSRVTGGDRIGFAGGVPPSVGPTGF